MFQQKKITAPLMKQYLEQEGELLSKADNKGYEHYLKVRSGSTVENFRRMISFFFPVQVLME